MGLIRSLLDALARSRSRKRIALQFRQAGFKPVICPEIDELLPFRYPEIIHRDQISMFEKDDMQMLVVPTMMLPRTGAPHRGRTFVLMCTPLGESGAGGQALSQISAALRAASEKFSIVDQLEMDTYPSLSPLPDYSLLAADEDSAHQILSVVDLQQRAQNQSLILHNGRLFAQVSC